MELKDVVSIVISAIAVLIALSTFLVNSFRKTSDDRHALRGSLNDVISKIFSVRIEQVKYIQDHPNWAQSELTLSVNNVLTAQLRSYARLADYIIPKIKGLVSDIELATVAETLAATGEQIDADAYWHAAIASAKSESQQIQYRRSYAAFLFGIGQLASGREEYQTALGLFRDNDDISKAQNGATYKFWGLCELRVDNRSMAENYFMYAKDLYSNVANDT